MGLALLRHIQIQAAEPNKQSPRENESAGIRGLSSFSVPAQSGKTRPLLRTISVARKIRHPQGQEEESGPDRARRVLKGES